MRTLETFHGLDPRVPVTGAMAADARRDSTSGTVDEFKLLELARGGDPNAFGALIDQYSKRIYTHLFRLVRNREEAEDLAQETFLRAYRFLHRYDASRPFRNWLYTIATHIGFDALRSRKSRGALEEGFNLDVQYESATSVRDRLDGESTRDRLTGAVATLSARSATLIHLHYQEGMTLKEAAEIVGMTEGAAKVALHRARRELRERLVSRD